jgi:thiol-disulfide isomerase/thioredoxin
MLKLLKKNKMKILGLLVVVLIVYLYREHSSKNIETFEEGVAELMFFSAEWCGHCKDFKPTWKKLVKEMDKPKYKNKIILQNYDSDKDTKIFKEYNVKQFPTLLLKFEDGTTKEYDGDRDVKSIKIFIDTELKL